MSVKQSVFKGYLLRAISFSTSILLIALSLIGLFVFYRFYTNCRFKISFSEFVPLLSVLAAPMLFLTVYIGSYVYKKAQRHLVPLANETTKSDTRPPIVFLRSFYQDPYMSAEEQKLEDALKRFGPFIAIGNPEDKLPPLGAGRFYVGSKNWQSKVIDLLDRAALVIILAGSTPGLAWEISQVRLLVPPSKLLFAVSGDKTSYDNFKKIVEDNTDIVLPQYPHTTMDTRVGITALIRLDGTWTGIAQLVPKDIFWKARRVIDREDKEALLILEIIG
jgi:hypothetical protein